MEEKKGFTVVDRRFAGADDTAQASETASAEKPDTAPSSEEPAPRQEGETEAGGKEQSQRGGRPSMPMPPVDFATFVLSISSHIPVYLGEMADPYTGQTGTDLPLAQHLIDTLAMLQEKTRGNLDRTEENLLNGLLYDFRVRYVKAVQ